jgi:hypothetical protein
MVKIKLCFYFLFINTTGRSNKINLAKVFIETKFSRAAIFYENFRWIDFFLFINTMTYKIDFLFVSAYIEVAFLTPTLCSVINFMISAISNASMSRVSGK